MKKEFSAGKWEIYNAIPDSNSRIEIKSDEIIAIGIKDFRMIPKAIAFCGWNKNEQAVANAKLIAAAPELLEIAIKCLHWCNNVESFDFVLKLKEETENVIKKATN